MENHEEKTIDSANYYGSIMEKMPGYRIAVTWHFLKSMEDGYEKKEYFDTSDVPNAFGDYFCRKYR